MTNGYNGAKTNTELVKLAIDEIRENRQDIKLVQNKLSKGAGKIAANRQAIIDLKEDMKIFKYKTFGIGALAIIAIEVVIKGIPLLIALI